MFVTICLFGISKCFFFFRSRYGSQPSTEGKLIRWAASSNTYRAAFFFETRKSVEFRFLGNRIPYNLDISHVEWLVKANNHERPCIYTHTFLLPVNRFPRPSYINCAIELVDRNLGYRKNYSPRVTYHSRYSSTLGIDCTIVQAKNIFSLLASLSFA